MFLLRVSNSSLYFVKRVPITSCFEFPEKSLQFPFFVAKCYDDDIVRHDKGFCKYSLQVSICDIEKTILFNFSRPRDAYMRQ